jgi:hypothetical protein
VRLSASVDRSTLVGSAAVRVWDGLAERPCEAACDVTALRASDLAPIRRAVAHGSSMHGFLELRPGAYQLLLEPRAPQFLPSMRSLVVPAPGPPPALPPAPVRIEAPLRPSPAYPCPAGWIALRGTVEWHDSHRRVRWAVVYGTIGLAGSPGTAQRSAWTRSNAQGEFALFLRSSPPNTDGVVPALVATVEIHAGPEPDVDLPDGSRADLGLDDGSDDDVRASLPLARTLAAIAVRPGDDLSINVDTYTTTPPGTSRLVAHKVIRLT